MFHTIFFLFYYISFFVLSPIRFCYIFYNFEVIFLFFGISPLHSSLSPISGVPPLTSGRRLTSGRLASPAFRGTRTSLACTSHHANISSPRLPGCSPMPYGSWASFPAELFLRSRGCVEFPEKKVMWSAKLSEEKG